MKKSFFLICISTLFLSCLQNEIVSDVTNLSSPSHVVSKNDAIKEVENFLNEMNLKSRSSNHKERDYRKIKDCYIVGKNTCTRSEEIGEQPLVYVVNFENNLGYAIVSGDSRTTASIIAMVEQGYLDPEEGTDIPAMGNFLENMEKIYRYETLTPIHDEDDHVYTTFSPWTIEGYYGNESWLIWGQDAPYNNLAPVVSGVKAPAGCSATALAQTLAYPGLQPKYYKEFSFDWDEMLKHKNFRNGYPINYPAAYDQISHLFQLISTSENLDVFVDSGARPENIVRTLRNMGFTSPGTLKDYNSSEVENHLRKGISPVIITAYAKHWQTVKKKKFLGITIKTTTINHYDEGHAFVLEKLMRRERIATTYNQGEEISKVVENHYLVKVNWGWDGWHNGYYYHKAFDGNSAPIETRGTSGNYQFKVQMIIGIQK